MSNEYDDIESPCGLTTFNGSLYGSSDYFINRDGSNISDTTLANQDDITNITPRRNYLGLSDQLLVSEARKNPSNESEFSSLHIITSFTSCHVPPDETRSAA